jgi:ketosteroid isomerase-like protein
MSPNTLSDEQLDDHASYPLTYCGHRERHFRREGRLRSANQDHPARSVNVSPLHRGPLRREQSMEKADVSRWLDDYVQAWKTYDRDAIGALFSDDVSYRYHPYDEPVRGRDAVVSSWLGESEVDGASARDDPGTYDAAYVPVAVDGDVAVATGRSTYYAGSDGPVRDSYDNCFVMRFDSDGRCSEFTEWYMKRPAPEPQRRPAHAPPPSPH